MAGLLCASWPEAQAASPSTTRSHLDGPPPAGRGKPTDAKMPLLVCFWLPSAPARWSRSSRGTTRCRWRHRLRAWPLQRRWVARSAGTTGFVDYKSRLDPGVATGLALTVALALGHPRGHRAGGARVPGANELGALDLDDSVAQWGADHAGPVSEKGLTLITQLGEGWFAVVLVIVVSRRRLPAPSESVDPRVPDDRARRPVAAHERHQGAAGPRATDTQSDRGDAGPVVPERSHDHGRSDVGSSRARSRTRSTATAAHSSPAVRSESPSPLPALASSSTCTGSPTRSPGSSSAGPGSLPVRSRSAALLQFGAVAEEAVHEAASNAAASQRTARLAGRPETQWG